MKKYSVFLALFVTLVFVGAGCTQPQSDTSARILLEMEKCKKYQEVLSQEDFDKATQDFANGLENLQREGITLTKKEMDDMYEGRKNHYKRIRYQECLDAIK